jgi:Zn finger protein HypA/HybF involved in hydrogenase expression
MPKNWKYKVTCQECGIEEMKTSKDVYRCRFCGSPDIDIDDRWEEFLEKHMREEEKYGVSE